MIRKKKFDILAFGAACVDINMTVEEGCVESHGLQKGLSLIIEDKKVEALINTGTDVIKTPGGPGANVAMGISLRGGSAAMISKVANDDHGVFFTQRIQSHGIDYMPVISADENASTTCVVVLTTPDKERSFASTNGASYTITPEDVDLTLINQAEIVYFDSYLWLSSSGIDTVHHAAAETKKSGGRVAMALNDAGLIARNRLAFLALTISHTDILLGDQREFMALFGTATLEETVASIKSLKLTASITAGASGAYVVENGTSTHIPAQKIKEIVDTCGAGDQFAAGFLYGLAQGKSVVESGLIGAQWAADIIQHRGAEPKIGKNAPPPTNDPSPRP